MPSLFNPHDFPTFPESTAMSYLRLTPPSNGEKISVNADGTLTVPNNPIIPFIEGDGTGADIWAASVRVIDAAVEKHTTELARLSGLRFMPEKNRMRYMAKTHCFLMILLQLSKNLLWVSKVLSLHRLEVVSVR